jgi:hypothetical protein
VQRVESLLRRFFKREQGRFVDAFKWKLKAEKSLDDDDRIDDILEQWDALVAPIQHELDAIYREAAREARAEFDAHESVELSVLNSAAFDFAKARAAELVGRKWKDGELVDNPNARWTITDMTREKLRDLVEKAFDAGMTPRELNAAIDETGVFSQARAEMIARTEMSRAQIKGSLRTAKEVGVVGKESETSGDHDRDDECDEAEDMGVVALDDDFGGLGDGPPFHPNCNCALVFYTADDAEAADLVPAGGAEEEE